MVSNNVRPALSIIFLSGAVVAGHFLPGLDNSEIENGIRNSLHTVVFAIFAIVIFESLPRWRKPVAITATLLLISMIGGVSEFMQFLVDKRPDPLDIARDLSGATLAILGWLAWQRSCTVRQSKPARTLIRSGAFLLGTMVAMPLLYWLTVIALNRSTFPTILSFDNWWESHLYGPINAKITTVAGPSATGAVTQLHLSNWGRSGLLVLPRVSNWTEYEYLTFLATMVEGPDTNVTVRINDGARIHHFSDRFLARIVVTDKMTLFRISLLEIAMEPGHRAMDLSDIQEISIFARDKRDGTVMLLDEIRLE